jgi:hypothetical protein
MKRVVILAGAVALLLAATEARADVFLNGDFETGSAAGWTTGTGYRASTANPQLTASSLLPGGPLFILGLDHSSIVSPGLVAETGNQLNQVYSGSFSWRVEDQTTGGYGSAIQQQVNNYTDPEIFFAWAAVLEGAHGPTDAATVKIILRDVTAGVDLISREYNAADGGGGVDPRFQYYAPSNHYWTPWQIEQLTLPVSAIGHNLVLSILASDCEPTGHEGFLFLDGFGAALPPTVPGDPAVPEPASLLLMGLGLAAAARRRLAA